MPQPTEVPIRALCISEDPDRPTIATFIGLQTAGVELSVICPDQEGIGERLAAAGIHLADIAFRQRVDRDAIDALRRLLVDRRIDLLHMLGNRALQNGLIASRGLPVRLVAYRGIVGNVSFLSPVSWMRQLNPRLDRIVCVADAVRDYFLSMRPAFLRIPPHKLVTIHKGHSLDWYQAAPIPRESLGVPSDAFMVVCVANYRPRKGIEVLVEALAALPAECPVHLVLVGRMDGRQLDRAIDRSPLRDRIHRTGARSDAPAIAAAADAFVLPSIKREGLARSLIEAMAYATAPVVTDCGGSPELVEDGECGFVVPTSDPPALAAALTTLYRDPALRRRFGQAARERIRKHFRIEDTIARTLELYRSLVAAPH